MCFSAGASFAGALVLGATGVATLKTNRSADSRLFASVPVIFALQQAAEGLVWLALKNSVSGPALWIPAFLLYLSATIIPFFISGKRRMWLMGLLFFVSCLLTGLFYKENLTSVWCFFAAIISVVVFWILRDDAKKIVVSTAA